MINILRPALSLFLVLSIITGLAYPFMVTGIGRLLFSEQTAGGLIVVDGQRVGATLIGQNFSDPKYFWGRLSATSPMPYNAASSSGSNLGPLNPALLDAVKTRIAALKDADPTNTALIPVDLVTASASGLDPHISPAAAEYQINRIARLRHRKVQSVRQLVEKYTEGRQFGMLGEPRMNVLAANRALDGLE